MTSSDLLIAFRAEMVDIVMPYLWEDAEIFSFIDEAQTLICRETVGIADARTPAVTQINVVPGTDWYTTHSSILNIRNITRGDTGIKVDMLTAEQANTASVVFLPTLLGPVKKVVLGLDAHAIRIAPMPNETVTLNLAVYRLPLVPITDIGDQMLEIDIQHHVNLMLWMKHRAYDKQDAETFDRRKSEEYEQRFKAYCARVSQEMQRARRVQGNVAYGGF